MEPLRDLAAGEGRGRGVRAAERRAWIAAGCFALGLFITRYDAWMHSSAWFALGGLTGGLALLARGRACAVFLSIAMITLGAGWMTQRIHESPHRSLERVLPREGAVASDVLVTLEGVVLQGPTPRQQTHSALAQFYQARPGQSFRMRALRAVTHDTTRPVDGTVAVSVAGDELVDAPVGRLVRVTGVARGVEPALSPGGFDLLAWARQEGFAGVIRCDHAELVERLSERPHTIHGTLAAFRENLRSRAARVLDDLTLRAGDDAGVLIDAVLLGQRSGIDSEVEASFRRVGLGHMLAISGLHLAILVGLAGVAMRAVGDFGRLEGVVLASLVIVLLVLVPARAPVVRAGVLVLALVTASGSGRRYSGLAVLAWIGLGMLIWRPLDLWNLGFQLSFAMVALLMALGMPVHRRMFPPRLKGLAPGSKRRFDASRQWLEALVSTSVVCWVGSMPLLLYHVGIISPLGVITTVLVMPLLILTLGIGYLTLLLAMFIGPLAGATGTLLGWLATFTTSIVAFVDWLPGSSAQITGVSLAWTLTATGVGLWWLQSGRLRSGMHWLATIGMAAWLAVDISAGNNLDKNTLLRLDALAVGDGTCIIIRSGEGTALWDCGSLDPDFPQRVVRQLDALGVQSLDCVFLTHPNFDHYNALPEVMAERNIGRVLLGPAWERVSGRNSAAATMLAMLNDASIETVVCSAGETFQFGHTRIEILWPKRGLSSDNINDLSLVARLTTSETQRTALLTGDIEADTMKALAEHAIDLRADVLEAPHHGSASDAAYAFVLDVDPKVVLQSTGRERAMETTWNHARRSRVWLTTAREGWSWVEFRRNAEIRAGSKLGGQRNVSDWQEAPSRVSRHTD